MDNVLSYRLYLIFIVSFFLHLPARISIFGVLRIDLLLILIIFALLISGKKKANNNQTGKSEDNDKIEKLLKMLFIYSIITLPIVRWPGSVINSGLPSLVKAMVFFFFTISLITTEARLKTFLKVFIICQIIRVMEPLYLNQVYGYWGSQTYMGGIMMDRLSGSPYDVINSNGLAFVIVSVLPFFYYSTLISSFKYKLLFFSIMPMLLYALILTASRTGILALGIVLAGFLIKSKRKLVYIVIAVLTIIIVIPNLDDLQRDRYLSIISSDARGSSTVEGRFEGIRSDINVAMERPLFGHGLGTSLEANTHVAGSYMRAHNLYAEILQELGVIGLIIFLLFIKQIIKNFSIARKKIKDVLDESSYLINILNAMQIWLVMNILFSFASYGLTSYEWYLFGGLSVVLLRLSIKTTDEYPPLKNKSLT